MLLLPLFPYFLVISLFLGASLGCVSAYNVVRKQSLLGDIMSHASLPGIVYMFLLFHTKNISILLCGGVLSAIISSLMSFYLQKNNLFAKDTPFAIILSWFFSAGIIGMAIIQKKSIEGQSLINNFIFGNILTCANKDFLFYIPLLCIIFFLFVFTYRIQEVLGFDHEYALLRYSWIKYCDALLLFFSIVVIVIGLQAVGVLLMGSLIIAPGTIARLLTKSYGNMLLCSIIMTIVAFLSGIGMSLYYSSLPTGPLISLFLVVLCVIIAALYKAKAWRKMKMNPENRLGKDL